MQVVTPENVAAVAQAIGVPATMLLIWGAYEIRHRRNGKDPMATVKPVLDQFLAELRTVTRALDTQTRVNEQVLTRLIEHSAEAGPAIDATARMSLQVSELHADMERRQREGR